MKPNLFYDMYAKNILVDEIKFMFDKSLEFKNKNQNHNIKNNI